MRGLTFGSVADAYERFRLGYPEELADRIEAYATRPLKTALEVGAGTGKATRLIAGRGIAVTACEPDAEMARVLRTTTAGWLVTVVQSTFEDFTTSNRFDLLYAASAWHWTDPSTRWSHTAELLRPGGTVALIGGGRTLVDLDLIEAVTDIRRTMIADEDASARPTSSDPDLRWPGNELAAEPGFVDLEQQELPRVASVPAEDFVGHLSTISAYLLLPEADRLDLLERIRAALPATVEVDSRVTLHLARWRGTGVDKAG